MKIIILAARSELTAKIVRNLKAHDVEVALVIIDPNNSLLASKDRTLCNDMLIRQELTGASVVLNLMGVNCHDFTHFCNCATEDLGLSDLSIKLINELRITIINIQQINAKSFFIGKKIEKNNIISHKKNIFIPKLNHKNSQNLLSEESYFLKKIFYFIRDLNYTIFPTLNIDKFINLFCPFQEFDQKEFFLTDRSDQTYAYNIINRILDVCISLIGLSVLCIPMVLIALLVRVQDNGPAFFVQRRIGRYGKEFNCIKFRTMKVGTEQIATHKISSGSVTKLGTYIRKFKIDELPQLWNVLLGEMSLVGPRPCLPSQQELIRIRMASGIFEVRPGITGLAQIMGVDMSSPAILNVWDSRYLAFRSLKVNFVIILKTLIGGGSGDKVRYKL